jgi:hypothetical protein
MINVCQAFCQELPIYFTFTLHTNILEYVLLLLKLTDNKSHCQGDLSDDCLMQDAKESISGPKFHTCMTVFWTLVRKAGLLDQLALISDLSSVTNKGCALWDCLLFRVSVPSCIITEFNVSLKSSEERVQYDVGCVTSVW